jgi:hypothetical protein
MVTASPIRVAHVNRREWKQEEMESRLGCEFIPAVIHEPNRSTATSLPHRSNAARVMNLLAKHPR